MQGSRRLGKEAEHRPVDHRPAASPAPLARRPRLAARPDAQRGGVGPHRRQLHQRLLQHGDVLAEPGDLVHRAVSRRARRRAHPDRGRPAPGPPPRTRGVADDGRGAPQRRGSAPPGAHPVRQERAADRLEPRLRERARPGDPEPRPAARARRVHGGLQGQVAPHPPERREDRDWTARRLDRCRRAPDRARLRISRLGGPRRGREHEGGELRRRQRRRGRGLGRGLHPADRTLVGARVPAGAVLPRRLAGQPPRRARLPGVVQRRRLRAGGLLRPGRRAAPDP